MLTRLEVSLGRWSGPPDEAHAPALVAMLRASSVSLSDLQLQVESAPYMLELGDLFFPRLTSIDVSHGPPPSVFPFIANHTNLHSMSIFFGDRPGPQAIADLTGAGLPLARALGTDNMGLLSTKLQGALANATVRMIHTSDTPAKTLVSGICLSQAQNITCVEFSIRDCDVVHPAGLKDLHKTCTNVKEVALLWEDCASKDTTPPGLTLKVVVSPSS